MMPRELVGIACLGLASLVRAAPADAQDSWALFAVETQPTGLVTGIPIALVSGRTMTDPPVEATGPIGSDFLERFLSVGSTQTLLLNGTVVGTVRVQAVETPACVGLGTRLEVNAGSPLPLQWRGLAVSRSGLGSATPLVRPLLPAEADSLYALGLQLVSDTDTRRPTWPLVETTSAAAVLMPDGSALVIGTFEDAVPAAAGLERFLNLLVGFEARPSGYSPSIQVLTQTTEVDASRPEVWDVIDLDEDGIPEIILLRVHYESWDFSILRYSNGAWGEIYSGGGAGC